MTSGASFEDTLRAIVRDVVREEVRAALAAGRTRNATEPSAVDGYMSISNAAAYADVAPGTLRRWIREERISARRAGRDLRVSRTDLERFLVSPRVTPAIAAQARRTVRAS